LLASNIHKVLTDTTILSTSTLLGPISKHTTGQWWCLKARAGSARDHHLFSSSGGHQC